MSRLSSVYEYAGFPIENEFRVSNPKCFKDRLLFFSL